MGQVNVKVADSRVLDVRARLKGLAEKLGISQGQVIERGMELIESGSEDSVVQKVYERAGRIENMVEELLSLGTPIRVAPEGSSTPILDYARDVVDNRPKNCQCKHCPERFAGMRFATICPACKSSGHTNAPAECPRCTEGIGA